MYWNSWHSKNIIWLWFKLATSGKKSSLPQVNNTMSYKIQIFAKIKQIVIRKAECELWTKLDQTGKLFINFPSYHKFPKYLDTQKICCNRSKIWSMWLYHRVMSPNDADGMANSVDPDQTAPLGAVWSASALFAQAYLSENLGSLRYVVFSWHSPGQTFMYR